MPRQPMLRGISRRIQHCFRAGEDSINKCSVPNLKVRRESDYLVVGMFWAVSMLCGRLATFGMK